MAVRTTGHQQVIFLGKGAIRFHCIGVMPGVPAFNAIDIRQDAVSYDGLLFLQGSAQRGQRRPIGVIGMGEDEFPSCPPHKPGCLRKG